MSYDLILYYADLSLKQREQLSALFSFLKPLGEFITQLFDYLAENIIKPLIQVLDIITKFLEEVNIDINNNIN